MAYNSYVWESREKTRSLGSVTGQRERVRGGERKRGEERESLFQSVLQVDSRRYFFPGSMREVYCCSPSLR